VWDWSWAWHLWRRCLQAVRRPTVAILDALCHANTAHRRRYRTQNMAAVRATRTRRNDTWRLRTRRRTRSRQCPACPTCPVSGKRIDRPRLRRELRPTALSTFLCRPRFSAVIAVALTATSKVPADVRIARLAGLPSTPSASDVSAARGVARRRENRWFRRDFEPEQRIMLCTPNRLAFRRRGATSQGCLI